MVLMLKNLRVEGHGTEQHLLDTRTLLSACCRVVMLSCCLCSVRSRQLMPCGRVVRAGI